jgi:hypothetical protein
MSETETAWCWWHQCEHPRHEFNKNAAQWNGLQNWCRVGRAEHDRAHPEKRVAHQRKYKRSLKGRTANSRHRMKRRGIPGEIPPGLWEELYEWQRGCCGYCWQPLNGSEPGLIHLEHRLPGTRGGTNDRYNLFLSCGACNLSKGKLTDYEWRMSGKFAAYLRRKKLTVQPPEWE